MSLTINRRAIALTGLTGALLLGGALTTSTAAQAADDTTGTTPEITISNAAETAESTYPDCDVTAALLYDTDETPIWDVELTCDSGTVKYVSIDAETGKLSTTNASDAASDDSGSATTDDDDSTSDETTDPNDALGTGANDDYN